MTKQKHKTPKVRLACPNRRPIQLRYFCPDEGREIRISTHTHDQTEAEAQKRELEAKLLLGIPRRKKTPACGPYMPWEVFRDEYRELKLSAVREKSADDAESRLDIAEAILRPRTLADVADSAALHRLQARLLAGDRSRHGRPRAAFTVKSYMRSVLAALNWARSQGWLDETPRVQFIKTAKLKAMKGRPIGLEEFERMLAKVPAVVGDRAAPSWEYILWGLWESALRIDELMHLSWDLPNTIRPVWRRGRLPVLEIPAALQKNDTEEAIPLLPGFEALLLQTPEHKRSGWIFEPISLQTKLGRAVRHGRPQAEWVGKIVSKIGKVARVVVDPGDPAKQKPVKYASAHDLRRSCAERLLDAGVPVRVVQQVLRHASFATTQRHYAPGDVQKAAGVLRMYLGTPETHQRERKPVDVAVSGGSSTGCGQYTPEDSNL